MITELSKNTCKHEWFELYRTSAECRCATCEDDEGGWRNDHPPIRVQMGFYCPSCCQTDTTIWSQGDPPEQVK